MVSRPWSLKCVQTRFLKGISMSVLLNLSERPVFLLLYPLTSFMGRVWFGVSESAVDFSNPVQSLFG